jgi:mannobiose 2-epimerase
LWTFSAAFCLNPNPKYKEMAYRAYEFFPKFIDEESGGVYWMLDYKGNLLETKKQVYAQGFAIYALTEFYQAFKVPEALNEAINLYKLLEEHAFDKEQNGYFEAYSREWQLLEDLRLSDKDANEKKTMNTHLHVLEAYTNLYRVWKDKGLYIQLKNLLNIFLNVIVNRSTGHLNLFFDEDWTLKSRQVSFGHDVEAGWLMQEAAEVLGDESLIQTTKNLAVKMTSVTLEEGMDDDGGLFYEGVEGVILDDDKHWWPQAEAMVGFYNAYQNSGNTGFRDQFVKTWYFIRNKIVDKEHGEWYGKVSKSGIPKVSEDKVGAWKCPYHNARACIELLLRFN